MPEKARQMWGRISEIFENGGELSKKLPGFELRQGQVDMAKAVFQSFAQDCISIIEAGTGTGKTLAYLVPAVFFSLARNEPVVVSTRTINLQEQLLKKDIPLLSKIIGEQFRAVLVKGWSNYVCLRRLKHTRRSGEQFSESEFTCFNRICDRIDGGGSGDRGEFDFDVDSNVWDLIKADALACINRRCPWYETCFFFLERNKVKDANILVTNHALLFSYVASKRDSHDGTSTILPDFKRLIFDEAHHVEEVASDFLGDDVSSSEFLKLLDSLYNSRTKNKETGILARIRNSQFAPSKQTEIFKLLDNYVIPRVRNLKESAGNFFSNVAGSSLFDRRSDRVRIEGAIKTGLQEGYGDDLESFIKVLDDYGKNLGKLMETGVRDDDDLAVELTAVTARFAEFKESLIRVWNAEDPDWIYSLEYNRRAGGDFVRFKSYPLSISEALHDEVFHPLETTVLTSATLSINRNFKYLESRLGLDKFDKDMIISRIIESPFDFKKQALLTIPTDMPLAKEPTFLTMATTHLASLIRVMDGRTFILFTSYKMLEECAELLRDKLEDEDFNILVQGETSRHLLLKSFMDEEKSVLLGTDSFWEGVDVPGSDLECVVLMKLPFKVPTDPIIKARTDYIQKQGKDPFLNYHVPQAIIRFKQGFGRLVRSRRDKGAIVVLDRRIVERRYGRAFLTSLPPCRIIKGAFAQVVDYIEDWLSGFDEKSSSEQE